MPKPLAEIVMDAELATAKVLASAAEVADAMGEPLIVVLVREFDVDELAIVKAVRRHARIPLAEPDVQSVESGALRLVSHDVCRRLRAVPLTISDFDAEERLLRVAMADPTDQVAIAEIEHHTACHVEPRLMALTGVEELAEQAYRRLVTKVIRREPSNSSGNEPNTAPAAPRETARFHRVADEAGPVVRIRALVDLLVAKGIVGEEEYQEAVRQVMKRRDGEPEL